MDAPLATWYFSRAGKFWRRQNSPNEQRCRPEVRGYNIFSGFFAPFAQFTSGRSKNVTCGTRL
jgi:hypothetical protein